MLLAQEECPAQTGQIVGTHRAFVDLLRECRESLGTSEPAVGGVEALLIEFSPDAMLIAAPDGTLRQINRQAELMFGYSRSELMGQSIFQLVPKAATGDDRGIGADLTGLRKNGEKFPVGISLSAVQTMQGGLLIVDIRDVTDYKKAELELADRARELECAHINLLQEIAEREKNESERRLAQKLEAIGQLASGIAHEINTPMQYIGDSIHFLRRSFDDLLQLLAAQGQFGDAQTGEQLAHLSNRVPRAFERTVEGIDRVTSIVRAMKDFAHPYSDEKIRVDINEALASALIVSRNEYKYVAEVETSYGPVPEVPCRAGEINQVFLNLIVNAAHAIGEAVQGTSRQGLIKVHTAVDESDPNVIVVQIGDNGTGIPEAIRERIFEPFFTTKPVGKGTGQGLAISRSIVDKHGGALTFESEPGCGTTFSIRLPLSDDGGEETGAV
jgi:PAS domain S-box-containing protein